MLFSEFRGRCQSVGLEATEASINNWDIIQPANRCRLVYVCCTGVRYTRAIPSHCPWRAGGPLEAILDAVAMLRERDTPADEPTKTVENGGKPPLEFVPGGQYANPNHDMTGRVVDLIDTSRRLLLLSAAHMVATTSKGRLVNDELRRAINRMAISLHDFDDDLMPDDSRKAGA